jgi:pyruvate/2-oxoglutarate dehydrogenase complex dihydrolipoamide acyltransferase (E2) component
MAERSRVPLVVPPLGSAAGPVSLSLWLVPPGARVMEGDRVVELAVGGATIDLEAPLSGRLVAQFFDEDEPVAVGAVLAEFEADAGAP